MVVHGDGPSPWTLTYATDFAVGFVGLFELPVAGEAFTITSDDVLLWDAVYRSVAAAAAAPEPQLVAVASERIAALAPELGAGLLGDKSHPAIFDNAIIKSLVPDSATRFRFPDAARAMLAWYEGYSGASVVNPEYTALADSLAG